MASQKYFSQLIVCNFILLVSLALAIWGPDSIQGFYGGWPETIQLIMPFAGGFLVILSSLWLTLGAYRQKNWMRLLISSLLVLVTLAYVVYVFLLFRALTS